MSKLLLQNLLNLTVVFRHEAREGGQGGSWNRTSSNSSSAGQSKSNSWLGGEPCNLKVSQSATLER